jgi:hypothetical protein
MLGEEKGDGSARHLGMCSTRTSVLAIRLEDGRQPVQLANVASATMRPTALLLNLLAATLATRRCCRSRAFSRQRERCQAAVGFIS